MSKILEPETLLEWARDLGRTYSLWDSHVHPFDVLTGDLGYEGDQDCEGLFSKRGPVYRPPRREENLVSDSHLAPSTPYDGRAFLLASRLKYTHTGSRVIRDQLAATGLSRALLLPVARVPGSAEQMLEASKKMFPDDTGLKFACAIPIGIPADRLLKFFAFAQDHYKVCAIKIHPNLADIDLLTSAGHDLIESTLEAAGALGLPVIIHGGRTSGLGPSAASEYGILSHLETINWSLSGAPVIFAHAGCYELTEEETSAALSKLDSLLQKYPNLMADTSNLEFPSLRLVLKKVNPNRLLFGSDALYIPIWKAWLRFLRAVQDTSHSPDNDLIRIAALNPSQCLGVTSTVPA